MTRGRLLLITLLAAAGLVGPRHMVVNRSQTIFAESVMLDPARPERDRVGALRFDGAWELSSRNGSFGGLSALLALPGDRFLAVGDSGLLVGFALRGGAAGESFIAALPDARGALEPGKAADYLDRDAESLTADRSGRIWVGYEQRHAIRRFDRGFARRTGIARPAAMARWPSNGGAEAILALRDGRFLAFAEAADGAGGGTDALVWRGDPTEPGAKAERFAYVAPAGFRVTGAAQLPDGRLLLLHRRLTFPAGFSASLGTVDAWAIRPGAVVRAREIARLAPPLTVDNMEGLAVRAAPGGTTIWVIGDNNFTALQRTLLMRFFLPDSKKPEAPAPGFDVLQ